MPHRGGSRKIAAATISTRAAILTQNPPRTISLIVTLPVPNMIAFGGVPTGSMNAQLAAMAQGTMRRYGWISSAIAKAAMTGRIIVAVAAFEVISVRNSTSAVGSTMISRTLVPSSIRSRSPIQAERPLSTKPAAMDSPPPNSRRIPHGIYFESAHWRIRFCPRSRAGNAKSTTVAMTAIMPSLTWDQGGEMAQHAKLRIDTGLEIYFCDPHSPWQRGSNENTNGMLRQYFPKGTDHSRYSHEELDAVAHTLNTRPRKTLAWRTPAEALNDHLNSLHTNGVATTG